MNFEIYAYWNTTELVNVFNAVAAITGSGDFNGLLRTLALVVIISLVVAVLAGRSRQEDFWRWVVMLALLHGMLLVPKSNVLIVDRTGTNPSQVVSNVPIGLAALAHGTSKIGDWLTTAFETVFSLPDDVQLRKTGTLFGHRVMLERLGTQFSSPVLMRNLDEFYRECVIPDLATGYISPSTLATTENIWQAFSNTNPGLLVTIADYNDPSVASTMSCPEAYAALTAQLNLDANTVLGLKAQGLFPEMSMAAAKVALSNALLSTQQFFAPSSTATPVLDQIKQGALCNYLIDAPARVAAQIGDAAQVQQATATAAGIRSFKTATTSMYSVAMSGMPKFRNAVEMIAYAVFPIVVIMIVVAGQYAGTFLKGYVGSLLWVQLWPPLYAVMNYMMNIKTQSEVSSMVAANGNAYLSCNLTNWLGTTAVDDMNVAAYLTLSIPIIAWGLVQGTLQAASSAAGAWMQGGGAAGGKFLDNTVRSDQMTAGQYNTAPTIRMGAPVRTDVGADGVSTTTFADGLTAVDASAMQHRINMRLNAGSKISAALQRKSEEAETAAVGNMVAAGAETVASLQKMGDFIRAHATGAQSGDSATSEDIAKIGQAYGKAQDVVKNFAKQHGLSEDKAAEVLGELGASGGLDLLGNGVTAKLKASGSSKAAESISKNLEDAFRQAQSFKEAMERAHQVSRQSRYDTGESSEARGMRALRASLDSLQRHSEQASANFQQSLAFKEEANRARENSAAWETGMVRQFINWMGTQRNELDLLGRNFDPGTVAQMAEKNPELLTPFVERFFKERVEPTLSVGVGEVKTPADVQAFFERGKERVGNQDRIVKLGEGYLSAIENAAAAAGVSPSQWVSSQLPAQAKAELEAVGSQILREAKGIDDLGTKEKRELENLLKDPGSLLIRAISNAGTSVLPEGTTFLLDKYGEKLGLKSGSFAKETAQNYKGSEGQAWAETGFFVAGMGLGVGGGMRLASKTGDWFATRAATKAEEKVLNETLGRNFIGPPPEPVAEQARRAGMKAFNAEVEATERTFVSLGLAVGDGIGNLGAKQTDVAADLLGRFVGGSSQEKADTSRTQPEPPVAQPASPVAQPSVQPTEQQFVSAKLGDTLDRGTDVAADLLGGFAGGSSIGKLFGGGQRPVPPQQQPERGEAVKDDGPPPSGR